MPIRSAADVRALEDLGALRAFSREPFRRALATWLKHGPTPTDIERAAAKSPDRWAQGTAILGRLAGYSDRIEVDQSLTVHHLSDAELEARIAHLTSTLRALPASPVRAVKPPRSHDHPQEPNSPTSTTPIAPPEPATTTTAPVGEQRSSTAGEQHAQRAGDTHRPSPGPARARARSQRSAAQVQG